MNTGVHTLAADAYHADLIDDDRPSLSAGIAKLLVTKSAAHARWAHPRLNPNWRPEEDEKFRVGKVAHRLLLEGATIETACELCNFGDWRSNAAKEARQAALDVGKVPLLVKHADAVEAMVAAAREQIEALEERPLPFTGGAPEQTIAWEEKGVLCRALVDWLHDGSQFISDYKTTAASAAPDKWVRTMMGIGGDVQAVFHARGVEAVLGVRPEFRFVVQEVSPPYLLSFVGLPPAVLALAEDKVDYALSKWRDCLERDEWPGYPRRVCYVELPGWEETRWLEKEAREEAAA